VNNLNNELEESERRGNEIRQSSVSRTEQANLKKELSSAKKSLTSIYTAFKTLFLDRTRRLKI
jgi:hypothetical protein